MIVLDYFAEAKEKIYFRFQKYVNIVKVGMFTITKIIGDVLQMLLDLQPILGNDLLFLPASRMGLMLLYKEYL